MDEADSDLLAEALALRRQLGDPRSLQRRQEAYAALDRLLVEHPDLGCQIDDVDSGREPAPDAPDAGS